MYAVEPGYKERHEAFVSNNNGCGVLDVLGVLIFCPISLLFTKCAMHRYYNLIEYQSSAIREKFGRDILR